MDRNFSEYLKAMKISEDQYNQMSGDEQSKILEKYIDVGFSDIAAFRRSQREAEEKEKAANRAAAEAASEAEAAYEKKLKEKEEKVYNKWDDYFHTNLQIKDIADPNTRHKFEADREANIKSRFETDMADARRVTPLKDLLFAEAEALDDSLRQESWERCVPVGGTFADAFDIAKAGVNANTTLSQSMNNIVEGSIEYNMYSHLLEKYDTPEKFEAIKDMSGDDVIRDIFKNDNKSLDFYIKHRDAENRCANTKNLDAAMQEMFRLGERMSRNSRMSGPMEELCAKLDSLKEDYTANPKKYQEMPKSKLDHLMQSITASADKYVAEKAAMGEKNKSYSSTQLERLKCINQLKSVQETFMSNIGKKDLVFTAKSGVRARALAEKLVMAKLKKEDGGVHLCDRMSVNAEVDAMLKDKKFNTFVTAAYRVTKNRLGITDEMLKKSDELHKHLGEDLSNAAYDSLMKVSGSKLYAKFENLEIKQQPKQQSKQQSAPAKKQEDLTKKTAMRM